MSGGPGSSASTPSCITTSATALYTGQNWLARRRLPRPAPPSGYGLDGDQDGRVDVYDPGDAIPSAARFLQAHGAPASGSCPISVEGRFPV